MKNKFRLSQMDRAKVSNNFNERIEQKIFHAEIVVDTEKVKREESNYQPIPIINDFKDADGNDCMKFCVNYLYKWVADKVKMPFLQIKALTLHSKIAL